MESTLKWAIIYCEGPQDLAVLSRILTAWKGYKKADSLETIRNFGKDYETLFRRFLAGYPQKDCFDLRSMMVPAFYFKKIPDGTYSVVICKPFGGIGDPGKGKKDLKLSFDIWAALSPLPQHPHALGCLIDADDSQPNERAFQLYSSIPKENLPNWNLEFLQQFPKKPNSILPVNTPNGYIKMGLFILPDGENPGKLEDLVIGSAPPEYQKCLEFSEGFVGQVRQVLGKKKKSDAKRSKALISAVGACLQPGLSLAVTLENDDWIPAGNPPSPPEALAPLLGWLTQLLT